MAMTEAEYDKAHRNTRIVINALFASVPVMLNGYELRLGENDKGIALLVKLSKVSIGADATEKAEDLWITLDWGFNYVMRLAQKMTDDEVALLAANISLNTTKRTSKS